MKLVIHDPSNNNNDNNDDDDNSDYFVNSRFLKE